MRRTAGCIAAISAMFLYPATLLYGAEQKVIFNTENIKYESGTGPERCRERCSRKSGPDVAQFLSGGWRIVSTSPKEVVGEHYRYVPTGSGEHHGCICSGTEYLLEKGMPAPPVAASYDSYENPAHQQTGTGVPDSSPPINEIELLKNKNKLLLKELIILKRENERLKEQLE